MGQGLLPIILAAVAAIVTTSAPTMIAGTQFVDLGFLPGDNGSRALGVSPNGDFVAGRSSDSRVTEGFVWSNASGLVPLGDLPGGARFSEAVAVSNTGIAAGTSGAEIDGAAGGVAFRWSGTDPIESLGTLGGSEVQSIAHGISADGKIIVGQSKNAENQQVAFRWTENGGMQEFGLGVLSQTESSDVGGISADGNVIVGYGALNPDYGTEGWRWTQGAGFQELGYLPGGLVTIPWGASRDGAVIVGEANSDLGPNREAFRWTATDGIVGLGELEGGSTNSIARAVSGDGRIVVGNSAAEFGEVAFIWDEQHGMRALADVLHDDYGISLQGWTLEEASGISSDGRTIVGWGIRPDGLQTAYLVTVPEPESYRIALFSLLGSLCWASGSRPFRRLFPGLRLLAS